MMIYNPIEYDDLSEDNTLSILPFFNVDDINDSACNPVHQYRDLTPVSENYVSKTGMLSFFNTNFKTNDLVILHVNVRS